MPPIPEEYSSELKDFLVQCFQREPADRPSAEVLCEHEWLKKHWGEHKELRPQESIPFLRRVSTDLQKAEGIRFLGVDVPRSDSQASDRAKQRTEDRSISPGVNFGGQSGTPPPPPKRLSNGPASPVSREDEPLQVPRDHSFIKTVFGKRTFFHYYYLLLIVVIDCANCVDSCSLSSLYADCQEAGRSLRRVYFNCAFELHPQCPSYLWSPHTITSIRELLIAT